MKIKTYHILLPILLVGLIYLDYLWYESLSFEIIHDKNGNKGHFKNDFALLFIITNVIIIVSFTVYLFLETTIPSRIYSNIYKLLTKTIIEI